MINETDLHIHTEKSDGSESVEKIIQLAVENDLSAIALTDHDYFHTDIPIVENLIIIPSIEVSTIDYDTKKSVHILGYGFDQYPEKLIKTASVHLDIIRDISERQIYALQKAKYDISLKEAEYKALNSTSIYKQHIMAILIDKGYTNDIYGELYRKLFKNGGICEMMYSFAYTEEILVLISEEKGIPVVAHPAVSGCLDQISKYADLGLMGIETYHCSHDDKMINECNLAAESFGLIETGGSDYHGYYGNEPMIGCSVEFKDERGVLKYLTRKQAMLLK